MEKQTIEEIADDIFTLTEVLKRDIEAYRNVGNQIEVNINKQVELATKLKSL